MLQPAQGKGKLTVPEPRVISIKRYQAGSGSSQLNAGSSQDSFSPRMLSHSVPRAAEHQPCAENRGGSEASPAALGISSEFAEDFMVLSNNNNKNRNSHFDVSRVLGDSTFIQSFQSLLEGDT